MSPSPASSPYAIAQPGEFVVYSDASVKGPWEMRFAGGAVKITRNRFGPAMAGWIGWYNCPLTTRPTIAGQAYLGTQGTQRAEYCAAIHALHAVLTRVQLHELEPERVVLRADNETVVKTLKREWNTHVLTPHRELADRIGRELTARGIVLSVELVSETNRHHRAAHRISQGAWNQLFFEESWRPQLQPPSEWTTPTSSARGTSVSFQLPTR